MSHLARAAEQALRRNAHREAAAHLTEALGQLERLPASRERDEQELALLTTLGPAQIALGGYGSGEAAATYTRARVVSTRLGDGSYLLPVLYGIWNKAIVTRATRRPLQSARTSCASPKSWVTAVHRPSRRVRSDCRSSSTGGSPRRVRI